MITDLEAIQFCNETVRPVSDRLASLYYDADFLKELKAARPIADFIAQEQSRIRKTADAMLDVYNRIVAIQNIWFNVGAGGTMSSKIPNDAGELVVDGSPADGRPAVNGANVVNMITNCQRYRSWFADALFGGPGTGLLFDAMVNTMVVVSSRGTNPLVESQVIAFVDNRCGELTAEYEAGGDARLTQLLAVSPNPQLHRV